VPEKSDFSTESLLEELKNLLRTHTPKNDSEMNDGWTFNLDSKDVFCVSTSLFGLCGSLAHKMVMMLEFGNLFTERVMK
jgi:hypothetical protein